MFDKINQEIDSLFLDNDHVSCPSSETSQGWQIGVAIMEKLPRKNQGWTSDISEDEVAEYAKTVHDVWAVGDVKCNNGILILFSILDRQLYVSSGKGGKDILTDNRVDKMVDSIVPYMRGADYDGGVFLAVHTIARLLREGRARNLFVALSYWCALL